MVSSDVYTELVARLNYPGSVRLLRILHKLVTPEEGKLLLELPVEPSELAQKLGLEEDVVQQKIHELMERGLVVPTSKGFFFTRSRPQPPQTRRSVWPSDPPQSRNSPRLSTAETQTRK